MLYRVCKWCKRRQRVEMVTDGDGRVLELPLGCGCEACRERGVCITCRSRPPKDGAIRCVECHRRTRTRVTRRYRARDPEPQRKANRAWRRKQR